jgi:hypothetical protein
MQVVYFGRGIIQLDGSHARIANMTVAMLNAVAMRGEALKTSPFSQP